MLDKNSAQVGALLHKSIPAFSNVETFRTMHAQAVTISGCTTVTVCFETAPIYSL
jgi:hypothetical protein